MRATLEWVRQSLHIGERTFRPTPNVRNTAMLTEAEDFSKHMINFKQALRNYHQNLDVYIKALPVISRGNLPRVWEMVEGGLCEPIRPNISHEHPTRIGGEFDEPLLVDTREILASTIDHDIITPVDRWLESLRVVRERMRKLEVLRLDVDARRRHLQRIFRKTVRRLERNHPRRTLAAGGAEGAGHEYGRLREGEHGAAAAGAEEEAEEYETSEEEFRLGAGLGDELAAERSQEDWAREALYYRRKLDAVLTSYNEQEQLVWEQLSGLVRDAAYLKAYVAAAFLVVKDAMQACAVALGPCKLPLPTYPERVPRGHEYGQIGSPLEIIADVPDSVKEGPNAPLPAALRPLSETPAALHAKRLTAQPLQTGADQTTPRYGPVPPVVKGATNILEEQAEAPTFQAIRDEVQQAAAPASPGTWPTDAEYMGAAEVYR